MINLFTHYSGQPRALTIDEMQSLALEISGEIGVDPKAVEAYEKLIETATRYVFYRSNWLLWDRDTKLVNDDGRTSCHDALIKKFNILAKRLKAEQQKAAWRDVLGYEEDDPYNRKRIGDFACYLVFINCLNAR